MVFTLFRLGLLMAALALSVAAPPAARAYVLQGPHLLELMLKHLGSAQRLLVVQKIQIRDDSRPENPLTVDETLRYVFPGGFRSDLTAPDLARIHLVTRGRRLSVLDGRLTEGADRLSDVYKDLMLFRSRTALQQRLKTLGIDPLVSSFGRFDGQNAYVVGAVYPDETACQVWVAKETFRPLRWIVAPATEKDAPARMEVRYGRWQAHGKLWYPHQIEMWRDGRLTRRLDVVRLAVNPAFSADLFDLQALRLRFPSAPALDEPPDSADRFNEVHQTIEEFKKLYE